MDYDHILGATDFSPLGDRALVRAAALARANDAKLVAMTVLPQPDTPSPLVAHYEVTTSASRTERARAAALEALRARIPAELRDDAASGRSGSLRQIDYLVRIGDPAAEILSVDVELRPDLIVLATHGRRGWRRWIMGSVCERIVQMAHADVLAVRERDEDEPE